MNIDDEGVSDSHYRGIFYKTFLFITGRLLDLPSNVGLGWKGLVVSNALAYYYTGLITAVKKLLYRS
jgi:hypothetical protein